MSDMSLARFRRTELPKAPCIRTEEKRLALVPPLFAPLAGLFLAIAALIALAMGTEDDPAEKAEGLWGAFGMSLLAALMLALLVYAVRLRRRLWHDRLAAATMARQNGWRYALEIASREYPATMFRSAPSSYVENSLTTARPRRTEVANFVYRTDRTTSGRKGVGFVSVKIDNRLPHLFLASTRSWTTPRPFPVPFTKDQRLSLEGDFDTCFELYCPRDYERDALYVLTPDVMALLIDEASGCDVEIVDDELFVIARGPFDMSDPRVLEFATRLSTVLAERTARQSARYSDDRSEDPAFVASAGGRLRVRGVIWAALPLLAWAIVWGGWLLVR